MNENEITKVDRKTVEEAIEFILQEGRMEGYQEAMKVYGKQYKEILKKGRRQGLVIGILTAGFAFVVYRDVKKNMREKLKEEMESKAKSKEPFEADFKEWED